MNKPKFRAWLIVNKNMYNVRGFDIAKNEVCIYSDDIYMTATRKFDDMIIMQYTGLKDKNGVEIYEGDVVKQVAGEYSYIGAVEKDCYQFYIDGIDSLVAYSFDDVADTSNCTADLEVIGNIHENPELLKK